MDSWIRLAIFALILISFLRRIFKLKMQSKSPSQTAQSNLPPTIIRPPRQGRKNDFRDVPPPPENPELG